MLVERGLTGVGVEVGVCQARFSCLILSNWPGFLHLVDSWAPHPSYIDAHYDHEQNYQQAIENLIYFADRIQIHRKTSLQAAAGFEDDSLDFVYIDANHAYEPCLADMEAWWPKLKQGGMMAGDDYGCLPEQQVEFGDGKYFFGVKRAVDEFSLKYRKNVSLDLLAGWAFGASVNGSDAQLFKARNWWLLK